MSPRRSFPKKSTTSQKCALETCGNMVRFDNPSFPYCRFHGGIKKQTVPQYQKEYSQASSDKERQRIYYDMYVPHKTGRFGHDASRDIVIASLMGEKFNKKAAIYTLKAWEKLSRGSDMSVPKVAREKRDTMLSTIAQVIDKNIPNMDTDIIALSGGVTKIHGVDTPVDDHKALLLSEKGNNYIVDVATSAPLSEYAESVHNLCEEGSTVRDGCNISHLAEFAMTNSIHWDTISTSDGELLWDNRSEEDNDIDRQRELLNNSPRPVFAPIEYKRLPEPEQNTQDYGRTNSNIHDVDSVHMSQEDEDMIRDILRQENVKRSVKEGR